jgi:2-octaprenyl-6-methoxyphenol hydroxylase
MNIGPVRDNHKSDVLISGGGLSGLTMALALAQGPLEITLADQLPPALPLSEAFDGRVSALSFASCRLLQSLGVWTALAEQAQPIHDIVVSDGRLGRGTSPFFLHFDHHEMREGPLGYIVENRYIRRVLHDAVKNTPQIRFLAPKQVTAFMPRAADSLATLEDGSQLSARLGIVAEGRQSRLRKQAGIRTIGWAYKQSGIVATIAHEREHEGIAHEYFLPNGPFAILPMTGRRSSLVWTEPSDNAHRLMELDEESFQAELSLRIGDLYGEAHVIGPRWSYSLSLMLARSYIAPRLALIGDSAHAIHPLAGQGFNLALRDVAALAEVVVDSARLGLDIGASDILERYQRWRRFDSFTLAVATDGLNRLFSNDIAPLRLVRDLGLSMVGRIGPARRFFMREAAGGKGHLPRALRGEPI